MSFTTFLKEVEQDNLVLLDCLLGKEMDITSLTFHPI